MSLINPITDGIHLLPLNKEAHTSHSFKEQIGVLYYGGHTDDEIVLLRSFVQVCQPGVASFDGSHPGADTYESWKIIDQAIEQQDVVGVFHTHPPGCVNFSPQDIAAQNGLAKSNGLTKIWHGIQSCGESVSAFVCVWMVHGRVFRYGYDWVNDNLTSPVIKLSMPYDVVWNDAYGAYDM